MVTHAKTHIRFLLSGLGLLSILLGYPHQALSQAPAVNALFPSGGQSGTTSIFNLQGKPGSLPLSTWVADESLLQSELNDKATELTLTIADDATPQLTWIRFYNSSGSSDLIPVVIGTLPQVEEKEPNQFLSEAHVIEKIPQVVEGVLSKSGEVDTFAVSLSAGETIVASLAAYELLGSPMDGVLQLLDNQGFVLTQNDDDHGFDPLLNFIIPETGTYYVRVFGFPATPNSTISFAGGADYRYRLTLTQQAFETYRFPVQKNQTTVDLVEGWNLDLSNETEGKSARLIRPQLIPADGSPLFSAEKFPATISLSESYFGVIYRADSPHHYHTSLEKGKKLRLQIQANSLGSFLDPVVSVKDSTGKLIKAFDDISKENVDIDTSWTVPQSETYSFFITDRYQNSGPRYYYQFQIEQDDPRFQLNLNENRITLESGKPKELNITVERLGGFEKTINFTVEGLPESVTYEQVFSEHKKTTEKKVTLKFIATNPANWNGPIRIVGHLAEEESGKILATAPTKLPEIMTSQIWLTLTKKSDK